MTTCLAWLCHVRLLTVKPQILYRGWNALLYGSSYHIIWWHLHYGCEGALMARPQSGTHYTEKDMEYCWTSAKEWTPHRGIFCTPRLHVHPSTRYPAGYIQERLFFPETTRTLLGSRQSIPKDYVSPSFNHNAHKALHHPFGLYVGHSQEAYASLPLHLLRHDSALWYVVIKDYVAHHQLVGSGTTEDIQESIQGFTSCNTSPSYRPI